MNQVKKVLILLSFVFWTIDLFAQKKHSHNDYEQQKPFFLAYELGFESIETDLFLKDGELFVAHNLKDIQAKNTFKALYLEPILLKIKENEGYLYKNKKQFQLLIDLKTDSKTTMELLSQQMMIHEKALKNIKIIVSGNMPKPTEFKNYDKIFFFDGRKNLTYSKKEWKRVGMVSASFADFEKKWSGNEPLTEESWRKIKAFVDENHQKNKTLRLWGTPNTILAFETLKKLEIDFIGTDDLRLLNDFLNK